MQAIARHFANGPNGYNSYGPPKKVDFLEAFVLQLVQREGAPLCHVERYIEGEYVKHNNNGGWVNYAKERNTPQAFAHFSFEASKQTLLICDIQGVRDIYTDPQVHTAHKSAAFGRGNLGLKGFEDFMRTHRCNIICRYLGLSNVNGLPIACAGTLPFRSGVGVGVGGGSGFGGIGVGVGGSAGGGGLFVDDLGMVGEAESAARKQEQQKIIATVQFDEHCQWAVPLIKQPEEMATKKSLLPTFKEDTSCWCQIV